MANAADTTVGRWDQQEPFSVNVPEDNPNSVGFEAAVINCCLGAIARSS